VRAGSALLILAACGHAHDLPATVSADRTTVVRWDDQGLEVTRFGKSERIPWSRACKPAHALVSLDGAGARAIAVSWRQMDTLGDTEIDRPVIVPDPACLYDLTGGGSVRPLEYGDPLLPSEPDDEIDRRLGRWSDQVYPGSFGATSGPFAGLYDCDVAEREGHGTIACIGSGNVVVLALDLSNPPTITARTELTDASPISTVRISRDGTTVAWTDGNGGWIATLGAGAPTPLPLPASVRDLDFSDQDELLVLTARTVTRYVGAEVTGTWHFDFTGDRVWGMPDGRILVSDGGESRWLR
jgi:hypothetical protein